MKYSASILAVAAAGVARADFFRNDFLPVGHVRTDAILSQTCLSDHVHTFYGPPLLYPKVTFDDLRDSNPQLSSGNIEENLSLYWHPAVYNVASDGTKTLRESEMTTVYYNWVPGQTTAFPPGFRMIVTPEDNVFDEGIMGGQSEMEISVSFPNCWKGGDNLYAPDQSHVAFPLGEEDDSPCPSTHPVRIPRLDFFIRFFNTNAAKWEFADGTGVFHADYISGWDEAFLQSLLDGGDGDVDSRVTFRAGIVHQGSDSNLRQQLKDNAVPMADTDCISTEPIDNIVNLPRGTCTGTLISPLGICGPTSPSPTSPPPTNQPTSSPTPRPSLRPTTTPPVTSSPSNLPTQSPMDPPPTTPPPSANPTSSSPTRKPTPTPTKVPTTVPTSIPTHPVTPAPVPPPTPNPTPAPVDSSGPTELRYVVCGRGVDGEGGLASCSEGDSKRVHLDELHEVRCCREQDESGGGWTSKCADYDPFIYGRSKIDDECHKLSFWDAFDKCGEADGRLCTKEEIENSCTKGTGCGHDRHMVWACKEDRVECTESAECCGGLCHGDGRCR